MPTRWLNDKQPDENGNYTLQIETHTGARVSTFTGKSVEEVAEKLAASQEEANITISNLRRPDTGRQGLRVQPRAITDADRLRMSTDITDPNKVVETVEEIFTARTGVTPDRVGKEFAKMSDAEQSRYYVREAQAFALENPDYYPVPQNRDALFAELMRNRWDITRNNFALAFDTLKQRGEMIPWPENVETPEEEEEMETVPPQPRYSNGHGNNGNTNGGGPAQPAPAPRPRSISTGIRNTDANAVPPAPPVRKAKYTRADIESMSRAEYNEKLQTDPEFRKQVDAMSGA